MEFNACLQELKHLWLALGLGLSLSFVGLISDNPPLHQIALHNGVYPHPGASSVITNGVQLENELKLVAGGLCEFRAGIMTNPSLTAEIIRCLPHLIRCGDVTIDVALLEKGSGLVLHTALQQTAEDQRQSFSAAMRQSFPNIKEILVSSLPLDQNSVVDRYLPEKSALMTSRITIILQNGQALEYYIMTDRQAHLQKEIKVVEAVPVTHPVRVSRGFRNYREVRSMEATAYYPGPECTGKWAAYGLTFTGKKAGYGIVAVDPTVIPLGSKLYVVGYGYAEAEDIGGLIKGNIIDLCFETYQEALNYGRQRVKVYILE